MRIRIESVQNERSCSGKNIQSRIGAQGHALSMLTCLCRYRMWANDSAPFPLLVCWQMGWMLITNSLNLA